MPVNKSATIISFAIMSFLLLPLMGDPVTAQQKNQGNSQLISESEKDDNAEDEEFEDDFEDEFEAADEEIFDPLSGYNSVMTEFNDGFYVFVLDPAARGYRWLLPDTARRGVKNFFHNLLFPLRFVNNALQLKPNNAGEEFLRFIINSTVGIFGIWDPAKEWFDLEAHEEDFGQTLGYYGVGGGFHIVLPFLGPSNLRDMFSLYPDLQMDPVKHVENRLYNFPKQEGEYLGVSRQTLQQTNLMLLKTVNRESLRIGQYANLKKDAIELYPFLRDVYEQNRAKLIKE
ncbi:MAG: putative phospholipid-binding lipoprotein MlaA [Deltaproteobacteria bacterium]|jgi:phospholipid-binding lipoprotein MlaA|nr:putative phospholipid-binding lipoprotein MlaA [Deltaproteobacteria bacterium]